MRVGLVCLLLQGLLVSLSYGCSGNESQTLQRIDPNSIAEMALSEADVPVEYSAVAQGFQDPTEPRQSGETVGWTAAYISSFQAMNGSETLVDRITTTIELYDAKEAVTRNFPLSSLEEASDLFEEFSPGLNVEAFGEGYTRPDAPDGSNEALYLVRLTDGPIIATVTLVGASDLDPETGRSQARHFAALVSGKVQQVIAEGER